MLKILLEGKKIKKYNSLLEFTIRMIVFLFSKALNILIDYYVFKQDCIIHTGK